MDYESMKITKFDSHVTNPSMQMAKAVIPYIDPTIANMLGVFIKFQELQNATRINISNLSNRATQDSKSNNEEMLSDLKNFLGDEEKNNLDMMLTVMELMQSMNMDDMNMDFMENYMNMFN